MPFCSQTADPIPLLSCLSGSLDHLPENEGDKVGSRLPCLTCSSGLPVKNKAAQEGPGTPAPRASRDLFLDQAMVNVEKQILHELGFGVVLLRTTPHRQFGVGVWVPRAQQVEGGLGVRCLGDSPGNPGRISWGPPISGLQPGQHRTYHHAIGRLGHHFGIFRAPPGLWRSGKKGPCLMITSGKLKSVFG